MRISRKTDYALRALFCLVDHWGTQVPMSLTRISKSHQIPRKFLEHIMLDLKEQGWVRSLPGRTGGYLLAVPPDRITLGEVVRCFDGVLAPIGCVSVTRHEPCSIATNCRFRRVFLEIRREVARIMDGATLASVAAYPPVTAPEVFTLEVSLGEGI